MLLRTNTMPHQLMSTYGRWPMALLSTYPKLAPCTGFQSLSVEIGFWIPPVSGIPQSSSSIPDSTAQDSCISQANIP